jgi:hypothetical protein
VLLAIELTCYREEISEAVAGDVAKENKSKKGDVKEDLGGKFLDMYSSIYTMRQDLDRIRKPVGTREHPVRTCKDLFYGHPQFKDGEQSVVQDLGTCQIFHINNIYMERFNPLIDSVMQICQLVYSYRTQYFSFS